MHQKALGRMRELVLQALDALEIDASGKLEYRKANLSLRPLSTFIAKAFAPYIREHSSDVHAFFSFFRAVEKREPRLPTGILGKTTDPAVRTAIADEICDFWSAVPILYNFRFPVPSLAPLDADLTLAEHVHLISVDRPQPVTPAALSGGLLSALFDQLGTTSEVSKLAYLSVDARGLMDFGDENEIPASAAIRTAKIAMQLGAVEGVFVYGDGGPVPETAEFQPPSFIGKELKLPVVVAGALRRLRMRPREGKDFIGAAPAIERIALVLNRDLESSLAPPRYGPNDDVEKSLDEHCGRIATATEWLFDALHSPQSATTVVQTAIAFETLYGGKGSDPVVKTLSNRVAYSLGRSPQGRERFRSDFVEFYNMRSDVVHRGATRLSDAELRRVFQAQEVLREALRHELSLLSA
jgi:Apea-like HEPN